MEARKTIIIGVFQQSGKERAQEIAVDIILDVDSAFKESDGGLLS